MIDRRNAIKLGTFFVTTIAVGIAMLGAFAGFTFWQQSDHYYVNVPTSVEGVQTGTPVMIRGVRVGSLSQVDLVSDEYAGVRLTLAVERDAVIKSDDVATLKLKGLTGNRFVDITGGTVESRRVEPGNSIPYSPNELAQLQEQAKTLVRGINALLNDMGNLVERIDTWTKAIDPDGINAVLEETQHTARAFTDTAGDLRNLIRSTQPRLDDALTHADRTMHGFHEASKQTRHVLDELDIVVRSVRQSIQANDDDLNASLRDIRGATHEFRELARRLREQPSSLLYSSPPQERDLP